MNPIISNEEQLKEVLDKIENGDTHAFRTILKNYQHYAYTVAFRVLTNDDDARDVVQECFVRIWKNIGGYNRKVKFTTWMYRIVINLCYDKLRVQKREAERCERLNDEHPCMQNDPELLLTNREQAEMIRKLTGDLPEKQRMVFVLRVLEDFTAEETAQILDISTDSVKSNLMIARRTIRLKLIERRLSDD